MSHPWVLVLVPVALFVAFVGCVVVYGPEKYIEQAQALRAERVRLYVERVGIHNNPAGVVCLTQRRFLIVPLGRECRPCAANGRRWTDLVGRQMPLIRYPILFGRPFAKFVDACRYYQASRANAALPRMSNHNTPGAVAPARGVRRRRLLRAAAQCRPAAEHGDLGAQINLAIMLKALGDLEECERWNRAAAAQGSAQAWSNLGVVLEGTGRTTEALECFMRGGELGDPVAARNAWILAKQTDPMLARTWLLRAARLGHPLAVKAAHNIGVDLS